MELFVTSDTDQETKISEVVVEIHTPTQKHFANRSYGEDLTDITVVLMCRSPQHNFKQRIRYSKKERTIYMDVMLDYDMMLGISHVERKREIGRKMLGEIQHVLKKRRFSDFDEARFIDDLAAWVARW